jgi:peptide/nickel transport system substrate-binding protein
MPRGKDSGDTNRRRFLKATGATALTAAAAGCSTDSDTPTEEPDTSDDTTEPSNEDTPMSTEAMDEGIPKIDASSLDNYPFGPNETKVGEAKRVMEQAGYGPDNRYQLDWLQYTSDAWKEMANTIRSRLNSAYIDMNISEAGFGSLLNKTEKGEHEAFTLGWIADYPAPQNFIQLIDPPNTVYGREDAHPNGARLFFSEDAKADMDNRQFMVEQFDRLQDNPEPSDEATSIRNEAAVNLEQGMWATAGMIPVYHSLSEVMWYDYVDYNPYGGMGGSRSKESNSVQGLDTSNENASDNRLGGINSTFNSLDPVASGNTASGSVIMNLMDAPMNYVNGTTEVEGLLVEDFSVSDDLTTYSFTLKEGVQFHGDWGEVTADDVVYSIRRLVESSNSTNTYFPLSVLNIVHETDDEGNVVADSTGVEKTGEYSFEVELESAFSYAVSVLAYGAFSVVPEGIVGDIDGYEGDISYEEFSSSSPIGCGPFVFNNWESGNGGEVIVDANPDYHDGAPAIDGIDEAIITDTNAAFKYFLNKNADVGGVPTGKYDPEKVSVENTLEGGQQVGTYGPLQNDETVNYAGVPTVDTFYIGFNMEKVPAAVRRAMAYVINKDQFVQSVFKGRGEAAFHIEPPQIFPGGANAYEDHWK